MPVTTEAQTQEIGEWTLRVRLPEGTGPHPVVLMLHGWTGDENVMWIFASRLPANAMLIAPRGLHAAAEGYSWTANRTKGWPQVEDFRPAAEALLDLLSPQNFPEADLGQVSVVGFSQGAALGYTLAMLHPERVETIAGLAGFAPEGAEELAQGQPLQGKRAFVAHGSEDEIVKIERARHSVGVLESAGAQVTFCEDQVGHKLSLNCFKGLQAFFNPSQPAR